MAGRGVGETLAASKRFFLRNYRHPASPGYPYPMTRLELLTEQLDIVLTALDLHPSNTRQSFKILRLNMRDIKADSLSPEITQLRAELVAVDDNQLRSAWEQLHNPFRESDRSVH